VAFTRTESASLNSMYDYAVQLSLQNVNGDRSTTPNWSQAELIHRAVCGCLLQSTSLE